MHAGEIVLEAHGVSPERDHQPWLQPQRDRAFWMGLAAAFLVHVALVVGISSARQRTVGAPDGAADAIAVEIVDGATLKDSMAPPTPPAAPPGMEQPAPALRGTQPDQPPPQPQADVQPPQEPQAEPEPPPPEVAEAAPPPPPQPEPQETPKSSTQALPELADVAKEEAPQPPEPAKTEEPPAKPPEAKETEAQKAEPKKPEAKKAPPEQKQAKQPKRHTRTSALDLSMPYDGGSSASNAGSTSAVQRPPGITKSGENDEFARNVIRALQRTMPAERAIGRVTVRIVLSENGARADVKLLKSGGNPDLDFNVMFAARQTAYPFPPKNATVLDRTFTVTYIYR